MAEQVGEIYFNVTLDTSKLIADSREVERQNKRTADSFDPIAAGLNQVTRAIGAYAAALFLVSQSDAYTKLNAQLKLATDNSQALAVAQDQVRRIAQEAQTDLSGVATLYARITQSVKELGVSQSDVAAITRSVALALKVSGAGAQESASATLQLSQAFASGVLRGEEFNAVAEAAPRLMKALADGIGVPIGALRGMAEQGKLTSAVLATALPKALRELEQEAQQVQTISGAFQNLRNELLLFVGQQTETSGAAKTTADIISSLASNIDTLAAAAYGFLAAKLARVFLDVSINAATSARGILQSVEAQAAARAAAIAGAQAEVAKQQATLASLAATKQAILAAREQTVAELQLMNAFKARGLTMTQIGAATTSLAVLGQQQARVTAQQAAATAALTAAQNALTGASTAAGTAGTLAARALGLLGGPIGAITTALGLGAAAWALWGNSAEDGETKAIEFTEKSTDEIVAGLDKQIARLKERNQLATAGLPSIAKQETDAAAKLAKLQGKINDLQAGRGIDGGAPLPEAARVGLLQTLLKQYAEIASKVREVSAEQEKLESFGTSNKLSEWMMRYASDAEKAAEEVRKARAELGSAFTPELEQRIRDRFAKKAPTVAPEYGFAILDPREQSKQNFLRLDKNYEATDRYLNELNERAKEDDARRERDRAQGQALAVSTIAGGDPVQAVILEAQRKSDALREAAARDLENAALYAEALVAIEQQTADRIQQIKAKQAEEEQTRQLALLGAYENLFSSIAGLAKASAGEQSSTYKALFAVQKAFAIASAIINIQKGISDAAAQGATVPAKLAGMALVASSTAGIISTIQGANFGGGRQYGGPAAAGTLYRVNETGAPEMFTAGNGQQYLLPTQGGQVTAADKVGGGWKIIINNAPAGTTATVNNEARIIEVAVARAEANFVSQVSENAGPMYRALTSATNVRGGQI